jgi:hypothetical protein
MSHSYLIKLAERNKTMKMNWTAPKIVAAVVSAILLVATISLIVITNNIQNKSNKLMKSRNKQMIEIHEYDQKSRLRQIRRKAGLCPDCGSSKHHRHADRW